MILAVVLLWLLGALVAACDSTCDTCLGTTANDCQTCISPATMSTGGPPGTCNCPTGQIHVGSGCGCPTNASASGTSPCLCNLGYYPNTNVSNCSSCDPSCKSCSSSSPSKCTNCYSGATLGGATEGPCACISGFVMRPDLAHCSPVCHVSCNACSGTTDTECTACFASAHLTGGNPGTCVCDTMTFPSPTPRVCAGCHPSCLTCSGTLNTQCLTCYANAAVDGSSMCICSTPLVPAPDARLCTTCDPTCLTCSQAGTSGCLTCKTNASLTASVGPAACLCDPGYFMNPPNYVCTACSSICLTCSGTTSSQCVTCYPNAGLIGTVPSACQCTVGFFPHPSVSNCLPCSPTCYTCEDEQDSSCFTCQPHASLTLPGPKNSCHCDDSYFPDPDARLCTPCHATCLTCSADGPNYCLTCKSNAELRSAPPGKCYCKSSFIPTPTAANCSSLNFCHATCLTCATPYATGCLSCQANAVLQGNGPNLCSCRLGFYGNPDSSACVPCHSSCASCVDSTVYGCTGCYYRATLNGGVSASCVCNSGTYASPNASNCLPCPFNCLICSTVSCFDCLPGYFLLPSASCSPCHPSCSQCRSYPQCTACQLPRVLTVTNECEVCTNCEDPLRPNVTSPYDHMYKIEFNRDVLTAISDQDLILETDPATSVSWTVIDGYERVVKVAGGPWGNNTVFTMTFVDAARITDKFGYSLSVAEVELPPPRNAIKVDAALPPPRNDTNSTVSMKAGSSVGGVTSGMVATFTTYVGGTVALSVAAGSASLAVPLLSYMAYFSYISEVGVPESAAPWFAAMNTKAALPNIFSPRSYMRGRRLAYRGALLSSGSGYLYNVGGLLSLFILISVVHGVLRVLLLAKCTRLPIVVKLVRQWEWAVYVHFVNVAYTDLLITSLDQIAHGTVSISVLEEWFATMISAIVCVSVLAFAGYCFLAIWKHTIQTDNQMVAPMVRNLRNDRKLAYFLYPVCLLQRTLFAVIVVSLQCCIAAQGALVVLPALGMLLFATIVQPFSLPQLRILHIISEIDTLFAFVLLFSVPFLPTESAETVSWVVLALGVKGSVCLFAMPVVVILHRYSQNLKIAPMMTNVQAQKEATGIMETDENIKSKRAWQFVGGLGDSQTEIPASAADHKQWPSPVHSPAQGFTPFKYPFRAAF